MTNKCNCARAWMLLFCCYFKLGGGGLRKIWGDLLVYGTWKHVFERKLVDHHKLGKTRVSFN